MDKRKRNSNRMATLLALCSLTMAAPALPQAPGDAEMSAEQKAAMEAWMKAMTPGKPHQDLAALAGSWEGKISMWDAPGAVPQISAARAERKSGLGGRVLLDHWNGSVMGMPFEGLGMTGYDNTSGKWWSTWSDNFSTGLMTSVGTCDVDPKRGCSFVATATDPMTGKAKVGRQTLVWPSPNDERMEMFDTGPDGKEFKAMEIVLRRAAGPSNR